MENNTIIITESDAITTVNNFKKFYNALRKINNIKIEKPYILDFLKQLLNFKSGYHAKNHFQIFPSNYKTQLKENESELIKIYEKYFKEHIGYRFILFLKTHNELDNYKDNLNQQLNETLLGRILCETPEYYINSFAWSQTKQGFQYWSSLNDKWIDSIYYDCHYTQFKQEYYIKIMEIIKKYINLYL